jgi:transcriptional regulator with XRE-family HTH domain
MYYENFEKLCNDNKTNPSRVSKATGISTATLTSWKKGVYTPKQDKLQLIADFFNVSVDYIMTGKESEFTVEMAEIDGNLFYMDKIIKDYALKLNSLNNDERKLVFNLIDGLVGKKED